MPPPNEIPKTLSSPAIAGKPSFLTTLPAEVRNCVYEVLFKRSQHILLHNADAYNPQHPGWVRCGNDERFREALLIHDEDLERNRLQEDDFKHDLGGGLALLLSCRQVYHKCAGVLYGGNTFVISRALHRRDSPDVEEVTHLHNKDYNQFVFAPIWLSNIGSHIKLVQNVFIDIDSGCPQDCLSACIRFAILPLMRII